MHKEKVIGSITIMLAFAVIAALFGVLHIMVGVMAGLGGLLFTIILLQGIGGLLVQTGKNMQGKATNTLAIQPEDDFDHFKIEYNNDHDTWDVVGVDYHRGDYVVGDFEDRRMAVAAIGAVQGKHR